jgi:hypothetical protein
VKQAISQFVQQADAQIILNQKYPIVSFDRLTTDAIRKIIDLIFSKHVTCR